MAISETGRRCIKCKAIHYKAGCQYCDECRVKVGQNKSSPPEWKQLNIVPKTITFRVTEDERRAIQKSAEMSGQNMSELIRDCMMDVVAQMLYRKHRKNYRRYSQRSSKMAELSPSQDNVSVHLNTSMQFFSRIVPRRGTKVNYHLKSSGGGFACNQEHVNLNPLNWEIVELTTIPTREEICLRCWAKISVSN